VEHAPNGFVPLVRELPLDFFGRKTLFGRGQKVHCYKPITKGQLGAMHHSATAQCRAETALLAFVLPLVAFPVVILATTVRAYNSFLVPYFLELEFAAQFIWIYLIEI